jgi:hypothetical protein
MSKWLIPEFEEFFISSGEEKKVRFDIFVPFDVKVGEEFESKVLFCFND